ncbi:MAG: DUF1569 domain-containing protein [Terrimonas sp.]|nr:DUF1569 domain-containing protein [Terrimonas sp.]
MEIKDLFDPQVRQEMLDRINRLTPQTKRLWGKMDVAQMLAHVQRPINFAYGHHSIKGSPLLKIIGPLFKTVLYNEKPYKQGLPTDPTYIVKEEKNFETEKQQLLDLLHHFSPENIGDKKHPVFGKMTREQWSRATWKHLDHHLKQFGV